MRTVGNMAHSAYKILVRHRERKRHLEGQEVNGRLILKWILKINTCRMLIAFRLIEDSNQWWALVDTVMNLWVP
jgi:hypothetical protein